MQRKTRAIALALCAVLALPQVALAAEGDTHNNGVAGVSMTSGYSVTMLEADDTTATAYSGIVGASTYTVYDEVAKMNLSFTGDSAQQYMVFLLQGEDTVPTESNLRYIDQVTGSSTTEFTIYPDSIATADTYSIYVSSTDSEYAKAGSFTVVASWEEAGYTLGDVLVDGNIDIGDALQVMMSIVRKVELTETERLAANVDTSSENIDIGDALQIMRYIVRKIDAF
ncbi:hypothetical protein [Chakrabartyella piscis]|uniref:hypothetical protein n=1 Tax=Chakrabartyella piscis TaxID=2918914 RepID=UPI002958B807|nr:hypothetical protein [Chakrabartyella piscis]